MVLLGHARIDAQSKAPGRDAHEDIGLDPRRVAEDRGRLVEAPGVLGHPDARVNPGILYRIWTLRPSCFLPSPYGSYLASQRRLLRPVAEMRLVHRWIPIEANRTRFGLRSREWQTMPLLQEEHSPASYALSLLSVSDPDSAATI